MKKQELKDFLDAKVLQYNQPFFIEHDPVQIPHLFSSQQDIETAGFFAATFAWGQRPVIISKSRELMERMDMAPFDFILNAGEAELEKLSGFVHRTFNEVDCRYFVSALQNILGNHHSLGNYFSSIFHSSNGMAEAISSFKRGFFSLPHEKRTRKHIADPLKGSTAKRLNMFLRWMIRKDECGVDFGLWDGISQSEIYLPLDLHSARTARKLGLLDRRVNDWKAVEEVTAHLRKLDPDDPVKYDYALFGLGVFEDF